jgi:hypothetical protein
MKILALARHIYRSTRSGTGAVQVHLAPHEDISAQGSQRQIENPA